MKEQIRLKRMQAIVQIKRSMRELHGGTLDSHKDTIVLLNAVSDAKLENILNDLVYDDDVIYKVYNARKEKKHDKRYINKLGDV